MPRLWCPRGLVFGARLEPRAEACLCGLTFELTPTAEAGAVRPGCDDLTGGAARPYSACRSGSGVERGVRPRRSSVERTCINCLFWAALGVELEAQERRGGNNNLGRRQWFPLRCYRF